MGEKLNAYRLLVGKTEGKRPLGRPRRKWLDNIRGDLVELRWRDVHWIGLAQDRNGWRALVNSVLYVYIYIFMVILYGCFILGGGSFEVLF
jgi:hypothetical protein